MAAPPFAADDLRAASERLTSSHAFGRAERSKRFLRYVVEQTLAGQADAIKEYAIAVEVFGRSSYDPRVDSVVRVEASKLRGLIRTYYEGEGRDDPVRIDLPKGAYVPRFESAPASVGPADAPSPIGSVPGSTGAGADLAVTPPTPWQGSETGARDAAAAGPSRQTPSIRRFLTVVAGFTGVVALLVGWAVRDGGSTTRPNRTTGQPALAVLPLTEVGGPGGRPGMAAEFTDELAAALARLGSLRMPSRLSVARYAAGGADLRQIGRELGVHAVLEGTTRIEDGRLRLSVALIDARDGLQLWSEEYDEPLGDLPGAQRNISATVARHVSLLGATQRALTRPHSANADAYQHYLRATHLLHAGDADLGAPIELYRAATVADPDYALAWASLSATLSLRALWGFGPVRALTAEAEAAARRAMALDPSLAESHQAVGRVQVLRGDLQAAGHAFERAIEFDPASIDVREDYAGWVLSRVGRLAEAREQLDRCLTLDAHHWSVRIQMAQVLARMGHLDEAERRLLEMSALESGAPGVRVRLGNIAARRGRYDEAVAHYESAAASIRSSWVLGHLGWGLARAGRASEARAVLDELRGGDFPDPRVAIAAIHAGLDEGDAALAQLEQAAAERSAELKGGHVDLRFHALRALPRFRALVAQVDGPEALRGL